ncbi:DUF2795 domain-containing protein [Nannocystis punicea]|uniref:DUF2795 domain-containing protein n=1 Tax=Nannocystis punicea TaxID=2995304 RepID=A0ABY7H7N6_9BACT|nr:DUF2795 domain-containing protein [Nannocystis poenicansa]WAS95105.1 DUF2795 domain-containing protein [Nannocystis poenicansa]
MTKTATSPIELTHQLRGIDFPVTKKDLIRHARDNNAGDAVVRELEAMPDQEFRSMKDVTRAMGQTEEEDEQGGERKRSRSREREGGEAREGGEERSRGEERRSDESERGGGRERR